MNDEPRDILKDIRERYTYGLPVPLPDVKWLLDRYDEQKRAIETVEVLMRQSQGVAGLHLNGGIADWDWLIGSGWLEGVER